MDCQVGSDAARINSGSIDQLIAFQRINIELEILDPRKVSATTVICSTTILHRGYTKERNFAAAAYSIHRLHLLDHPLKLPPQLPMRKIHPKMSPCCRVVHSTQP